MTRSVLIPDKRDAGLLAPIARIEKPSLGVPHHKPGDDGASDGDDDPDVDQGAIDRPGLGVHVYRFGPLHDPSG